MLRLDEQSAAEFAHGIQTLLRQPFLTRATAEPDTFRDIVTHRTALTEWFEKNCGWPLHIDLQGGTVRLVKRRQQIDGTRPAMRPGSRSDTPFDLTRYVLLTAVLAELVARPLVTIGTLADALAVVTNSDDALPTFDPANRSHRHGFVDVLCWLEEHELLAVTAGDLDRYASHGADAVIEADVPRIALLPASATPPSRITADSPAQWEQGLTHEPRYGDVTDPHADPETRNRWARHQLHRALLDDPAVDVDGLDEATVAYADTITGRQVIATTISDAHLTLERHADVMVVIDPSRYTTDRRFGDRAGHIAQTAGVLLAELVDDDRAPTRATLAQLTATTARLLSEDPEWARRFQTDGGARQLTEAAIDELVAHGLARRDDNWVTARPAASRFEVEIFDERPARDPTDHDATLTLDNVPPDDPDDADGAAAAAPTDGDSR